MITIFDYINDVLFFKQKNLLQNVDDSDSFNPYLVNRWVSMYSPECAVVVNSTVNWLYPIFNTPQDQYSFLVDILPRMSRRRISYIKKKKPPASEISQETIKLLARNLELSEREISLYIEAGLVSISNYEKNRSTPG